VKGHIKLKQTQTSLPEVMAAWAEFFARQETDETNNEIKGSARSMRAVYAVSLAVVSRAKSRHDSEPDNEEGSDDENDGPEKQPELETENPELQLGFCKAVVSESTATQLETTRIPLSW
jgi:hypothetical protein